MFLDKNPIVGGNGSLAALLLLVTLFIICSWCSPASSADSTSVSVDSTAAAADTIQTKSGYEEVVVTAGSASVSSDLVDDDRVKRPLITDDYSKKLFDSYYQLKRKLSDDYGLALGIDYSLVTQFSNYSTTDKQAASGIFRLYGSWKVFGSGQGHSGSLVYRVETRHVLGSGVTPRNLGFDGGSSLSTATFKAFGWGVTSLFWQQTFMDRKLSFVVGKMDPGDFSDVYIHLSAYKYLMNDAYFNNPTVALPQQGFGLATRIKFLGNLYVGGGMHDANGLPTEIGLDSFFNTKEYYTWVEGGWGPDDDDIAIGRGIHFNLWHQDPRTEQQTEETWGLTASANLTLNQRWSPFLRAGYSESDGGQLVRSFCAGGIGIKLRHNTDFLGVATSWSGPLDSSLRNQLTTEIIYRLQLAEHLQVSPNIQFTVNPSHTLETDYLWVVGFLRIRYAI